MYNNKRCTNKNLTQEELERELKCDVVADREIDDTENYRLIKAFMEKIEYMRSERQKDFPALTQEKLAEMAGIGRSTYTDYLSGTSDNIKLKTLINITHVLQCKLSDIMDEKY